MSEQWYCPNCGPVTEVEFEDGDLYTVCVECCENVEDEPRPFVTAMQERIAALEAVAEALVEIMPNLEMSYAIKTKQYNNLEGLLRAAGYLKVEGE